MKYLTNLFLFLLTIPLLLTANTIALAQKNKEKTYTTEVQALSKTKLVTDAFKVIDDLEPSTIKELIELTEIPAPPFKETARAQKVKQLFESAGADKVWIDSIGNVLALRHGKA